MPFAAVLRRQKRRIRPDRGEAPNTRFAIADGLRQLDALWAAGVGRDGVVLEMGSGWLPVIPLLFQLAGHERIILTDMERLMDATGIAAAKVAIGNRLDAIAPRLGLTAEAARDRLEQPFRPDYRAPWNPASSVADEVDVLISRCVFEHVPPAALRSCLSEFERIVRPGGHMCHIVDNSDHWQHIHHSRSRVEFLTWREGGMIERFARLNRYGYNNRLRHGDYLAMLRERGWNIVLEYGEPDASALGDLGRLAIAPPFKGRDHADLAVLDSLFVAQRPTSGSPAADIGHGAAVDPDSVQ